MALLFSKKMIFFHEIFQVSACPNLKDSSIYEIFSIHMYRTYKVRYLQLFCTICDFLMLWKVHYFGKRWFFSWNISSWCMPKFDRFLIIWNEFYSYVQGKKHLVSSTILSICDSLMPCMVHFFEKKKDDFSWTISSLCMPQLEKFLIIWQVFYPYVQGKKHWVSSTCPNLKDSLLYDRFYIICLGWDLELNWVSFWGFSFLLFLFICTRQEAFGIFNNFPLSASLLCLVRYIFLEKDDFSWNISSWCRPQLERFLIIWQVFYPYVQGIKHSVSSTIFLSLLLPHTK